MSVKRKPFDIATRELFDPEKPNKRLIERGNNYLFGLWGLTVHFVLLWGVLDINFHSPIIKELPIVAAPNGAPAKRVVLFVADGLRFQTFIDKPPSYLSNILKNEGVWGISHTRVPTESRPGHVAIAAGLYEDPSAIFKGWQENPVDFDSVFNQSRSTWAWGSPDIIPMFAKGSKYNFHGKTYPSAWQDFDANLKDETMRLDSWVFDSYLEWLHSAVANTARNQSGIILFLHLLGCDTIGHAKKPYSREYVKNMNYVDQRIEEIVNWTEGFFEKDSTAYIFTSDHGMTNWGSHGSGSQVETETPLIVWGAGIKASGFRQDVEQASIAPLIASLIGISVPINNEGALPWRYFDIDYHKYIAHSLLANVKQLAHQVSGNRAISCEKTDHSDREEQLNEKISEIIFHLDRGDAMEGIRKSDEAITFAKEALLYFRQYQRTRLLIYLSIMWLGWIIMLFLKIAGVRRQYVRVSLLLLISIGFASLLIIMLIGYAVADCSNWRLPCYASFAIISVWLSVATMIMSTPALIIENKKNILIEIGGTVFLLVVLFVGLTYRSILSIGILSTILIQRTHLKNVQSPMFTWTSLVLCVFPLLPVVEPYPRVYIVIISICITMSIAVFNETLWSRRIMEIVRLLFTSLVYTQFIDGRYFVSWIILLTTPLCIWLYPTETKERMLGVMLGFFCPLALLSASYEPLFFLTLTANLRCWLAIAPTSLKGPGDRDTLTTEDLTKAAFFMLYTLLCFFGTGNMASISSFDPSWTRHFVTLFSPFLMSSLILFKLSIPLILVGCINHVLESKSISLAVLFLGDCLSLPLTYCVTPYGSWLDIGSAISKFIIAMSLPCLLLLLQCLSRPLMKIRLKRFQISLLPHKTHIV